MPGDVLAPFIAEIAIMGYRDLTTGIVPDTEKGAVTNSNAPASTKSLPLPSEVLSAVIIFGAFSFIPNDTLRNLMCWGIVLATLVSPSFADAFSGQTLGSLGGGHPTASQG